VSSKEQCEGFVVWQVIISHAGFVSRSEPCTMILWLEKCLCSLCSYYPCVVYVLHLEAIRIVLLCYKRNVQKFTGMQILAIYLHPLPASCLFGSSNCRNAKIIDGFCSFSMISHRCHDEVTTMKAAEPPNLLRCDIVFPICHSQFP
jgi:hypothetical protein